MNHNLDSTNNMIKMANWGIGMEQTYAKKVCALFDFHFHFWYIEYERFSLISLSKSPNSVDRDKWTGKPCTKNVKAVKNQLLSLDLRQVRPQIL